MAGLLDFLNRGTNALIGPASSYGGLLSEEDQKAAQQQAQLALAAQLLDAGGYSPNRTSFGQALGRGMAAAGQAKQGSVDQALQAALLRKQLSRAEQESNPYGAISPDKFTPESLREFAKTKDYGVLVPRESPQSSASIAEFEFFQRLNPEQQKQFMALQRTPVLPQVGQVNGVTSLIDRTATDPNKAVMPLTSLPAEVEALRLKAGAEAQAKATGSVVGEAEGSVQKKAINAQMIDDQLDIAEPLIDIATGSGPGAASDKVAGFFGFAPDGAQATAQLQILQAGLMLNQPRMEGPQSDADVLLYRQAAGQLGDPTVPRDIKKAAVKTIRQLQDKYRDAANQSKERTNAPIAPQKRPPLSSFKK